MKIKLQVSKEYEQEISEKLKKVGFEIDEKAKFILIEETGLKFIRCRYEENIYYLPVEEVIYFESHDRSIYVHAKKRCYIFKGTLKQLEMELDEKKFIRVSNYMIVSIEKIKKIKSTISRKYLLTMENKDIVEVTRSYYQLFKQRFNL